MRLHPMHPAAWVLDQLGTDGWQVHNLLSFTRASTLVLVSRDEAAPVVLKAGFGSNHVLAELDEDIRPAAYGFYWYAEMTLAERALAREDFRHEIAVARTATGAGHVVPLLVEGTTDRFDWYTMPYCPGGSFRSWLMASRDPKTTAAGLGILADVAAGLTHLHDRGIVHRDVYQENVLIHNGLGMITDLGAARLTTAARGPAGRGPEVHWPPEYASSYNTATPAADVFSLAVLVYRFACGDLPRHGAHQLGSAPTALRPVVAAALAPDPRDRPSMADLHDALRQAAAPASASHPRRGL
ncbi:protein kinase domain-containing protein [Streptomyces microflavus]|uniref:protein kinase domain-containing protein n=1 Tax=Streptomyces microflavus TaxID=1919 RepID=UPI002E368ACD|nr:protein kinase [Streptomyces microflavus]